MGTPFFGRKKLVRNIKKSLYEVRGISSKSNTIATNIRLHPAQTGRWKWWNCQYRPPAAYSAASPRITNGFLHHTTARILLQVARALIIMASSRHSMRQEGLLWS